MATEILLASRNAHKIAELSAILEPQLPGVTVSGDDGPESVENGLSFTENALIKARECAKRTGKPAIADDSGLSVAALNGCPGIFSARWAGSARSDRDNLELVLWQISDLADSQRQAEFVCAAAAVIPQPDGSLREIAVLGRWEGSLLREPAGEHGFGYDPIFQPAGYEVSAAQLDPELKNQLSHRRRAFQALLPQLVAELG